MKSGYLSDYFRGVAAKQLSAVESDTVRSNQHEFNGVDGLKAILGAPSGKQRYEASFLYLADGEEPVSSEGFLTWYDAREKARIERGVNRSEYRLYFPTNDVISAAGEGDVLVIAVTPSGSLLAIVAEADSTIANQVLWLFGFSDLGSPKFAVRSELGAERDRIQFASSLILESIGVSIDVDSDAHLDEMLQRFAGKFPNTREFSAFARQTLPQVKVEDDLDAALMAWMGQEEALFRMLEKQLIGHRLESGFDEDVDAFVAFALSVINRRKSRVGLALENHLEEIFKIQGIAYSRGAKTENRSKPDFLFPNVKFYHDPSVEPTLLTMLGVKSSCKDRWRQVLPEADRIERKHLFTLETAISRKQTDEMQSRELQLVLPQELHASYTAEQQAWLISLDEFTRLVRHRERALTSIKS